MRISHKTGQKFLEECTQILITADEIAEIIARMCDEIQQAYFKGRLCHESIEAIIGQAETNLSKESQKERPNRTYLSLLTKLVAAKKAAPANSQNVTDLAEKIACHQTELVLVPVLNGGAKFAYALQAGLEKIPHAIEHVQTKSYHGGTSGGAVEFKLPPAQEDYSGKTVVIIEDILDRGLTLAIVKAAYEARGARVITVGLLDKPEGRVPEGLQQLDYTGKTIPNEFVIGYGLDYDEHFRGLSDIRVVTDPTKLATIESDFDFAP